MTLNFLWINSLLIVFDVTLDENAASCGIMKGKTNDLIL